MRKKVTPVRAIFRADSPLLTLVKDGLGAVEPSHKVYVDEAVRTAFADSLDADKALHSGNERENRWDYLLGHKTSGTVVGLEPHSAKEDEISAVIKKKIAAKLQLADHLNPGARVARWLWVASGPVYFANTERARIRLDAKQKT